MDAVQPRTLARVDGGGEVVLGQVGESLGEAGGQETVVSVAHGRNDLAHLNVATGFIYGIHALLKAQLDGLNGFVQAQARGEVLFRSPANLTVNNAVLSQVLHKFPRHPDQRVVRLHHGHGVLEGFQIAFQGT